MNDTPTPTNDEWIVTDNENYIEIASTKTLDSIASVHGGKTVGEQYDLAGRIAKVPQLERELTAVTEQRDKALQKIKNQAERIAYLEGATNHATGTPLSKAIEQRDRLAEAVRQYLPYVPDMNPIGAARHSDANVKAWSLRQALQSLNKPTKL